MNENRMNPFSFPLFFSSLFLLVFLLLFLLSSRCSVVRMSPDTLGGDWPITAERTLEMANEGPIAGTNLPTPGLSGRQPCAAAFLCCASFNPTNEMRSTT